MIGARRRRAAEQNAGPRIAGRLGSAMGLLLLLWLGILAGRSLLVDRPLTRAKGAYDRGSWREAATGAREILKSEPGQDEARTLLARAEARLGRAQVARAIYHS